ncbi:MAG: PEGA domain-containing protein [Polyangiaceae bacterium]
MKRLILLGGTISGFCAMASSVLAGDQAGTGGAASSAGGDAGASAPSQGGSNQGGSNQGGAGAGGQGAGGSNQGGSNQGGSNQGGSNQGGSNQGGAGAGGQGAGGSNQGGSNQGGSNQGGAGAGGQGAGGQGAGGQGAGGQGGDDIPPSPMTQTSVEDARSRMEKGQRLFADGKFVEAADEFASAYEKHKFSAFLFNAAVAAERGQQMSRAVDLYERFLRAEPNAPDRAEVEKTVERLKKDIASSAPAPTPPPRPADIKSLIFFESDPPGAPVSIYQRIDDKAPLFDPKNPNNLGYKKVISGLTTPTNLSLNDGTYFLLVEGFRDYNPNGSQFTFESGRVYVYRAGLSQGDFIGRVEVNVPVSTAKIYVDDPPPHKNAARAVGPNMIELTPGEHTLYVEAAGFSTFEQKITITQGKTVKLDAALERVPYGYLLVSGNADEVEIQIDDNDMPPYKRRAGEPLRIRVPAGEHLVEIDADGRQEYENFLTIPPGQEIAVDARLEEASGRGGAVVTTILAAGSLAGGIVLNRYIAAGVPKSDTWYEPLFYTEIGCFVAAGVFTGLAIFLFAWEPNDPSSAQLTKPREFTGETETPAVPEKKKVSEVGPSISVGLSMGAPTLSIDATAAPTGMQLGGMQGLVIAGRF